MKQTYLFLMFMLWATLAVAQDPFITTWEVYGSGNSLKIYIGGDYGDDDEVNFTVDFGDGTVLTNQTSWISHSYSSGGVYTVSITGDFPWIEPIFSTNENKLKSIEQWGDIEWTSMEGAFSGCSNLVINATDIPNLSQVSNLSFMFSGCSSLTTVPNIEDWDVSNVTNMHAMFNGATNFNEAINTWDVSNVTNMFSVFSGASSFNQPLNAWNVSNVTYISNMFNGASSFNQPLDTWDVSNVIAMNGMFKNASSFNQPLNAWDVSNVTTMMGMFSGASSFNQPLDTWDVSNVTTMRSMFYIAFNFDQPLNAWNVSNVTTMETMFRGATSFNQPLNAWDVSNVTNMEYMFDGAAVFNQPLDAWDVSNVTTMKYMFDGATAFNQSIGVWDYSSLFNDGFMYFLNNSGLSTANYDGLLERLVEINPDIASYYGLDAAGLTYCNEWAHDYLENTLGWNIEDAGVSEDCNVISGSVWYDIDGNGCETTVIPAEGFFVAIDTGTNTYMKSVQNGTYNITTNEESYTVSLANLPDYFTVSPESIEVDFATSTGDQVDFCVTSNQDINDLNITLLPTGQARPGFEATYKLVVKNLGIQSMDNMTASLLFDEAMQSFVEANPVTSATTTNSLEFTIATLAPFESWETSVTMQTFTPPTVNGDDLLNFTATVLPNTDDYTPNDNTFSLEQIVVNSYDPNDKQVLQGETIVMEQTGDYLDYLIRFQNTGSASAINIRVEDVLHDNLDWSTLSITSASHDYEVQITNGNEVDFVFNGIYLPAESQNEPESHGYIAYKIKPKTTVQVGDIMSGNASIYFDYNAPIITNTVTTEVVDVLGVGEYNLSSFITVYPNPINEGIYLEMNDGLELISAKLYNVQGRLLLETKETTNYIKTEQLSSGVYMLRLETNKGQLVKRVVKK